MRDKQKEKERFELEQEEIRLLRQQMVFHATPVRCNEDHYICKQTP